MQKRLTLADITEGLDGLLVAARASSGAAFDRGVIDSREARNGDLFFALHGEHSDGHDFIGEAMDAGAAGVVERPLQQDTSAAVFHVSDSLAALQSLAAHWRSRQAARVVGITGSVGKTTAKELIAHVLGAKYRVLKSGANLNTEIGIPLTLLQLREEHERAVLEMAMYHRGEIALLARISKPAVGVVTNIGPVHLERLGYMGAIVSAKAELLEALPSDGLAVLNGDDPRAVSLARRTSARVVYYGLSEQCDVRATDVRTQGLDGISFTLVLPGKDASSTALDASPATHHSTLVRCPLPGRHHVYPALAAVAVGLEEGLALDEITAALAGAQPDPSAPLRTGLRLTPRPGPNGSTIIDDSYNASPASMLAALDLLSELPGRRIALLGEMRELGAASAEGHRSVGRRAGAACDLLLLVGGEEARLMAEEARSFYTSGRTAEVRLLESTEEAAGILRRELRAGDYALVKASRAIGLERVVEALTQPSIHQGDPSMTQVLREPQDERG